MKSRTIKSIERMLGRAIPTAPIDASTGWFSRLNHVRFDTPNTRTALRLARGMVNEARPLMNRYQMAQWQKI
jgi:hypothetical protein